MKKFFFVLCLEIIVLSGCGQAVKQAPTEQDINLAAENVNLAQANLNSSSQPDFAGQMVYNDQEFGLSFSYDSLGIAPLVKGPNDVQQTLNAGGTVSGTNPPIFKSIHFIKDDQYLLSVDFMNVKPTRQPDYDPQLGDIYEINKLVWGCGNQFDSLISSKVYQVNNSLEVASIWQKSLMGEPKENIVYNCILNKDNYIIKFYLKEPNTPHQELENRIAQVLKTVTLTPAVLDKTSWIYFADKEVGLGYKYPPDLNCDLNGAGPGTDYTSALMCRGFSFSYEPLGSPDKNLTNQQIAELFYDFNLHDNNQNMPKDRILTKVESITLNGVPAYQFIISWGFSALCPPDFTRACSDQLVNNITRVIFAGNNDKRFYILAPKGNKMSDEVLNTLTLTK